MKVNITKLKDSLIQYNNLIENYNEIYVNMYRELSSCSTYWNDPNAASYFKNIELEKQKAYTALSDLRTLKDFYEYIIESYMKLGKVIEYDLNGKSKTIKALENYIEKLKIIIRSYDNLNLNGLDSIKSSIQVERQKLSNNLNSTNNYLATIRRIYSEIEKIELEISIKLTKIKMISATKKVFTTNNGGTQ